MCSKTNQWFLPFDSRDKLTKLEWQILFQYIAVLGSRKDSEGFRGFKTVINVLLHQKILLEPTPNFKAYNIIM